MAEVHPTPSHAGKVGSFLQQSTAGLPNWAWLLVIAGGIAAAIFIPKFLPGQKTAATDTSGSGLGLAVDPTTGLPYAVEGLVPSGANAGGGSSLPPLPTSPTPSTPTPPALTSLYTRGQQSGVSGPNDIPIWSTPNADWSQDIGGIPVNTPIQVGAPVRGTDQKQLFYPVSYNGKTGYVAGWDIAGVPAAQNYTTWPYANAGVYGGTP